MRFTSNFNLLVVTFGWGGENYLKKWITIINPFSPLRGRSGKIIGKWLGKYLEIFVPSESQSFVLHESEVA